MHDQQVAVLTSFPRPRPTTNPYITQLARALETTPGVTVVYFGWRAALTARYDVVHTHWPEIMLEGRNPLRRAAKRLLLALVCLRLAATRTAVVRTLHNVTRPGGLSRVDHALLSWLDRMTRVRILLNPSTSAEVDPGSAVRQVTILHGHYRDWFAPLPRTAPVPGRIAFVGRIRPYKGVEDLLETFRALDDDDASLTVTGLPSSPEVGTDVERRSAGDLRIGLDLRYVDDPTLVERVSESQLVVLPYRHMHNSGASIAALSLDRPVLVPDNEVNRRLAAEVGTGWVSLFADHLTQADLAVALAGSVELQGRPDLSARGWDDAGRAHAEAYRCATEVARRGPRSRRSG